MDETATRRKKIDPALYGVGWEQVPESVIQIENNNIFQKPVGAVIQTNGTQDIKDIIDIRKE